MDEEVGNTSNVKSRNNRIVGMYDTSDVQSIKAESCAYLKKYEPCK